MICGQASTYKIDFSFWQPMVQSIIMSFEKDWVMREMNLPFHLLCLYCLKLKRVLSHFQIRAWLYCKVKLFCIYASRSTLTSTLVAEFMACFQPAKGKHIWRNSWLQTWLWRNKSPVDSGNPHDPKTHGAALNPSEAIHDAECSTARMFIYHQYSASCTSCQRTSGCISRCWLSSIKFFMA